eukprot:220068_1
METVHTDNTKDDITLNTEQVAALTKDSLETILHLDEDVYNFYLLYRETEEYKQISTSKRVKIKCIVSLCFFIQLGLVLLLQFMSQSNYNFDTTDASLNCGALQQTCIITENKYSLLYNKGIHFGDVCARILSSVLVMAYIYPNIVAIPVYSVKYLQTKHSSWVFIGLFQIFTLSVVAWRVTEIVYKSSSIFEALSSGLGFIIVIEVDNILFNTALNNRRYNIPKELFYVKLQHDEVQHTIYSKFDVDTFDLILFGVSTFCIVFRTIIACSWYAFGYRSEYHVAGKKDDVLFSVLNVITILCVLFVGFAPFLFVWRVVCCNCQRNR